MPRQVTLRERLEAVKRMLEQRGDTVKAWCGRAGVTPEAVNKYLRSKPRESDGQPPTIAYEIVLRLADAAPVDRWWLLLGTDHIPRSSIASIAERAAALRAELATLEGELDHHQQRELVETGTGELSKGREKAGGTLTPGTAAGVISTLSPEGESRRGHPRSNPTKQPSTGPARKRG